MQTVDTLEVNNEMLTREMVESMKAKIVADRRNRKLTVLKKKLEAAKKSRDQTRGFLGRLSPRIEKLEKKIGGNESLVLCSSLNSTLKLKELNRMRRVHDLIDLRKKKRMYEEKIHDQDVKMSDLILEIEQEPAALADASTVNESDDEVSDVEFVSERSGEPAVKDEPEESKAIAASLV